MKNTVIKKGDRLERFRKIVQSYVEKADFCMNDCAKDSNQEGFNFWDGFHSCAENILRELDGLK